AGFKKPKPKDLEALKAEWSKYGVTQPSLLVLAAKCGIKLTKDKNIFQRLKASQSQATEERVIDFHKLLRADVTEQEIATCISLIESLGEPFFNEDGTHNGLLKVLFNPKDLISHFREEGYKVKEGSSSGPSLQSYTAPSLVDHYANVFISFALKERDCTA